MRLSVLIADDDEEFRKLLKRLLEREGGVIFAGEAADGEQAAQLAQQLRPRLILMDIGMPGLDGLAATRRIKLRSPDVKIIIITVHTEEAYRRAAKECGADGFVLKKALIGDLRSAISAAVRIRLSPDHSGHMNREKVETLQRFVPSPARILRAGFIELDLDRLDVRMDGRAVALTLKEFELLRALMEAKGEVVSRELLLQRIWGLSLPSEMESRTVNVHIHRLRRKLGAEGRHILTVKNVGYRYDVSFDWIKFGT